MNNSFLTYAILRRATLGFELMKKVLIFIEIVLILFALVFGFSWLRNPLGNYEPVITICGTLGVVIEFSRRMFLKNDESNKSSKSVSSSLGWIRNNIHSLDLSRLFPHVIQMAKKTKNVELEKWARLELQGYYSENGMLENDIVPSYRTVPGQHENEHGHPFVISDPKLGFINETRLRNGIKELEELSKESKMVFIREPFAIKTLREHLGVEVTRFSFSTRSVLNVLDGIRMKLLDKLDDLDT